MICGDDLINSGRTLCSAARMVPQYTRNGRCGSCLGVNDEIDLSAVGSPCLMMFVILRHCSWPTSKSSARSSSVSVPNTFSAGSLECTLPVFVVRINGRLISDEFGPFDAWSESAVIADLPTAMTRVIIPAVRLMWRFAATGHDLLVHARTGVEKGKRRATYSGHASEPPLVLFAGKLRNSTPRRLVRSARF